jgi:hypothetical protein
MFAATPSTRHPRGVKKGGRFRHAIEATIKREQEADEARER